MWTASAHSYRSVVPFRDLDGYGQAWLTMGGLFSVQTSMIFELFVALAWGGGGGWQVAGAPWLTKTISPSKQYKCRLISARF